MYFSNILQQLLPTGAQLTLNDNSSCMNLCTYAQGCLEREHWVALAVV